MPTDRKVRGPKGLLTFILYSPVHREIAVFDIQAFAIVPETV